MARIENVLHSTGQGGFVLPSRIEHRPQGEGGQGGKGGVGPMTGFLLFARQPLHRALHGGLCFLKKALLWRPRCIVGNRNRRWRLSNG